MRGGFDIGDEMAVARDDQRRLAPPRFVKTREQPSENAAGSGRDGACRTGRLCRFRGNRVVANGSIRDELIHVHFLQILNIRGDAVYDKESGRTKMPGL